MFYLNHFWKLLTSTPMRGLGLGLVQVLVLITLMNQSFFERKFIRESKEDKPRFFHSVFLDKKTVKLLKKNLVKLPGILSVEDAKDSFDTDQLSYLPEDLKQVMAKEIAKQEYFSLKISLADKIDRRSEELVKSFISKFNEETFLGSTETSEKIEGTIPFIEKYLFYEILAGLVLLWMMMVFICSDSWKNYFYVLNRSSRMTNPGLKIVLTGFFALWVLGSVLGGSLSGSNVRGALLFLPFILLGALSFIKMNFNRDLR